MKSMATALEDIDSAIKQIDVKKQTLKKAYDNLLHSHSSLFSSFSLSWSDLDAHFTTISDSLAHRLRLLQNEQSTLSNHAQVVSNSHSPLSDVKERNLLSELGQSPSQSQQGDGDLENDDGIIVVTRPELWKFCEDMDGVGLVKYVNENSKLREAIRTELIGAMKKASDAGLMVLDAMEVFYGGGKEVRGDSDQDRRSCVLLLEVLMSVGVEIGSEVKERAKSMAFEWRKKVTVSGDSSLEALGFLHLVAAYGLESYFDKNDFVEYLKYVGRYKQGALLCKAIDLGDKVEDLIKNLIENDKQLLAVKYSFEFKLSNKFPPVPLLQAYVNKSKKLAQSIRRDGHNSLRALNEAAAKEIGAYRAVIKVIEDYKLESVCPKEGYLQRIKQLEKQKADRKRPAAEVRPPKQLKKPHQNAKKHRIAVPPGHVQGVAGANSTITPFRQPHIQSASLPDTSAAYMNSIPGHFSSVGAAPSVPSYAGPSSHVSYGLPGAHIGLPGNTHLPVYSSEPQIPPGFYERLTAYGGYNLPPQYHSSYYQQ